MALFPFSFFPLMTNRILFWLILLSFCFVVMSKVFPPAIPDGDISCREQSFFEIQDQAAQEIFARRVVSHFRRSSKIELEGQVKLEDGR